MKAKEVEDDDDDEEVMHWNVEKIMLIEIKNFFLSSVWIV